MDTLEKDNSPTNQSPPSPVVVNEGEQKHEEHEHPIAEAIDVFLHRSQDIKAAIVFVAIAQKMRKDRFEKFLKDLEEGREALKQEGASPVAHIRKTQSAILHLEHLTKSELAAVVENSLFLGLFSAFDAFTGQLVSGIYKRKPQLYASLTRTINVADILQFKSFEELQASVLRDEIEDFRRKSYVDQFKELESKFGIKLRAFESWPRFVEYSQRRNLTTHCDGEVSEQYIEVCEREGYKFVTRPEVGDKLELGPKYFPPACDLASEVALKLGQTLWRKLLPEEIEEADKKLNEAIYNRLQAEDFAQAEIYGRFACDQKQTHSELYRRMFTVNLAIALKAQGKTDQCVAILKEMDWTACSQDFKLAEAVLTGRTKDACTLMQRIGKQGELVKEDSYHTWPLFRSFRTESGFLETYESIYGRPFITELKQAADKAQITAEGVVSTLSSDSQPPPPNNASAQTDANSTADNTETK